MLVHALVLALGAAAPAPAAPVPAASTITARHVRRAVGPDHHVEVQRRWFVVASNGSKQLHQRGMKVIAQAWDALYRDFFRVEPTTPVTVHLFDGRRPYRRFVRAVYGEDPDTPYGFYDPGPRRMVMNVRPGPGTLAHELVHPLIEVDFPGVPAWFNEGFAALMEHKRYTEDGRMVAIVNWRMRGLRSAMRRGRAVSLRWLMTSTTREFYADGGWGYALSRHLLLWLQRQGKLVAFYEAFRAGHAADPTGITALEQVLGEPLAETERRLVRWLKRHR